MISERKSSILQCPVCKNDLSQQEPYLVCVSCHRRFPVIGGMVVFLTEDDLTGFLGETWGQELQNEGYGYFASSEDKLDDLKKIIEEAQRNANKSQWPLTAPGVSEEERRTVERSVWPFSADSGLSEEAARAIVKSLEEVVKLSRARSARRILDWPTGPGGLLKCLINQVDPETLVIGLDVNLGALAKTKVYFDEYGFSANMLFVVADARRMPFKDSVFQSVTAWGGTTEIANPEAGWKETYRVLEKNGWFGISGDQYKDNSPSMELAEQSGIVSKTLTKDRLEATMRFIGFGNLEYEVLFEGYDIDLDTPDEERCPLPARGDWYQHIAASGQK